MRKFDMYEKDIFDEEYTEFYDEDYENVEVLENSEFKNYFKLTGTLSSKKNKKEKYKIGDKITYNKNTGVILSGPYEENGKQMFVVELNDGSIISIDNKSLKK